MAPCLAQTTAATARKERTRICASPRSHPHSRLYRFFPPCSVLSVPLFSTISQILPPSFSLPLLATRSFSRGSLLLSQVILKLQHGRISQVHNKSIFSGKYLLGSTATELELGHRPLRTVCQRSLPFLAQPVRDLFKTVCGWKLSQWMSTFEHEAAHRLRRRIAPFRRRARQRSRAA